MYLGWFLQCGSILRPQTPSNDTNHIKAVHIAQPIMWGPIDATTHY